MICVSSGQPFGYTNWIEGEPNDSNGLEDCIAIDRCFTSPLFDLNFRVSYFLRNVDLKNYITKMFHSPKNYQWMDLNCTDPIHGAVTHFAVCERIPA